MSQPQLDVEADLKMAPSLMNLPHEILHSIAYEADPSDLARLSRSCRSWHSFVKGNRLLHKEIYLKHFVSLFEV